MIKELIALQNVLYLTMRNNHPNLIKDNPLCSISIEKMPEHMQRDKDEDVSILVLRFLKDRLEITLEPYSCLYGIPSTKYRLYASSKQGDYDTELGDFEVVKTIQNVPKFIEEKIKRKEKYAIEMNNKYLKQLKELEG